MRDDLLILSARIEAGDKETKPLNLVYDIHKAFKFTTTEQLDNVVLAIDGDLTSAQNLHDEMLPGWSVTHAYWSGEKAKFCLMREQGVYAYGETKFPAAAYTAAILRALASMEDK